MLGVVGGICFVVVVVVFFFFFFFCCCCCFILFFFLKNTFLVLLSFIREKMITVEVRLSIVLLEDANVEQYIHPSLHWMRNLLNRLTVKLPLVTTTCTLL